MLIVRDGHHAALELIDGHDERVDRLEVQVIRRLVQNQQVRPRKGDDGERDTRFLPTGQRGDLLQREVAGDAKATEVAPQLLRRRRGKERHHELERRLLEVELVHVVLREACDARIAAEFDPAVDRRQLAHDELDQRRLADAVAGSARCVTEESETWPLASEHGCTRNGSNPHTLRPRRCVSECRRAGRLPRAERVRGGIQT